MTDSAPKSSLPASRGGAARIGAVSYLNTKPLVFGLADRIPDCELVFDVPSKLATELQNGNLDVALIPSVEYFRGGGEIVSTSCIGCRGPVMSVKVVFRKPPAEVKTLATDEGSRTSAALAQILLQEQHQVRPEILPFPLGSSLESITADAVLIIGDRAMHLDESNYAEVWDLGDRWCRHTELSFVFAMWVARSGYDATWLAPHLDAARDAGCQNIDAIAAAEAAPLGLTQPVAAHYLRHHLHFKLGSQETRGLIRYGEAASQLGLIPTPCLGLESLRLAEAARPSAKAHKTIEKTS